MEFIVQTGLCLVLLFGVFATLTKERAGSALTAVGITGVLLVKQLWLPALITLTMLGLSMLFSFVSARHRPLTGTGSLVSGLAGSIIVVLVFGIFFGPVTSVFLWLVISGLQLLPQFKSKARSYLFNSLWRSSLAAVWLGLGLYAVYGG